MDFNNVNPSLMKLAELLKMSIPKPSHGYTISEAGPEVVTAPGVYFPSEKGEVIPLQSRAEGGLVSPASPSSDTEKEKLSILRDIISVIKPRQGTESRQFGGPVSPDSEPSLMDQIEKTKYDIFKSAMSVLKPQKQSTNNPPKGPNMISRQGGGSVNPNILEELLSAMTPGGRGPFTKSGGGSYNERTSSYGSPSGPSQFSNSPSLPTLSSLPSLPGLPKPITTSSYGIMPEATKPSEGEALWQKKRAEQGWENPAEDLWEHKRKEAGVLDLTSRQYGGFVSPDLEELKKRKLWEQEGYPEARLAELRKNISPGIMGVQPGFQESYYEAHPEEKLMDEETYRMKPLTDAIMKSIKNEETRLQGYGVGFGPTPRELRAGVTHRGTPSQIPELVQGLKGLTPTLVAGGRKDVLPTGVTTPKQPTLSQVGQLITERDILPIGDSRRTTYDAAIKKATEQPEKLLPDTTPSSLREFEIAEGIDASKRGTPEYSKAYREFLGGKKEATRDPIEQKKLGTSLRKEFNALQPVKDYRNLDTKYRSMETAYKLSKTSKNFVAIDQAMISLFNKMTDPQSVVRESEYARTGQNLSVVNSIIGKMSKWVKGGAGITSEERDALMEISKELHRTAEKEFTTLKHEYRGYAVDYGLDPETVIKQTKPVGSKDFKSMSNDELLKALEE